MKPYEVIAERREEVGIPVSELARRAGIAYETLRVSLEGNRNIKADEFVSLCHELGLEIGDFSEVEVT